MKVLAIVLLCAVAAVQGRSAAVQSSRAAKPALGDVPYLVHLRIAIGTSGLLQTGVGSLISNNFVLTAASNVQDSRFIWIRFGCVDVVQPSMVLESNAVTPNPDFDESTNNNNLALLNVNRYVLPNENYYPVPGLGGIINDFEFYCGFGEDKTGGPGEELYCFEVSLRENGRVYSGSSTQAPIGQFDLGAPIVSEGRQTALLVGTDGEGGGTFQPIDEEIISWVEEVTGLDFRPSQPEPEPEPEA